MLKVRKKRRAVQSSYFSFWRNEMFRPKVKRKKKYFLSIVFKVLTVMRKKN